MKKLLLINLCALSLLIGVNNVCASSTVENTQKQRWAIGIAFGNAAMMTVPINSDATVDDLKKNLYITDNIVKLFYNGHQEGREELEGNVKLKDYGIKNNDILYAILKPIRRESYDCLR